MNLFSDLTVYVINLKERKDRYEHVLKELRRLQIHEARILHFDRDPVDGALGLFKNTMHALEEGLKDPDQRPILILEDDFSFLQCRAYLLKAVQQFIRRRKYSAWDTVRLGYSKPIFYERVSDFMYRGNCVATDAVIYSPTFARRLVEWWYYEQGMRVPERFKHIDHFLSYCTGRTYLPADYVIVQGRLGSDIAWYNAAAHDQQVEHPIHYREHMHRLGKKQSHSGHMRLLLKYHRAWDVLGWSPRIVYRRSNDRTFSI